MVAGLVALAVSLLSIGAANAAPAPVFVEGNPKCANIDGGAGWDSTGQLEDRGTASGGSFEVNVTDYAIPLSFRVTSGQVFAVIVKGGPNANVYYYNPPLAAPGSDGGLTTPTNPSNGSPYGLSHVEFCGGEAPPPSTTTTTHERTTTTGEDTTTSRPPRTTTTMEQTTTTGEATTTTSEATTTTAEATTTTDAPVSTQGSTTPESVSPTSVVVSTTAAPSTAAPTTAAPTTAAATTAAQALPTTGSGTQALGLVGVGLFLSGLGLMLLERRRGATVV